VLTGALLAPGFGAVHTPRSGLNRLLFVLFLLAGTGLPPRLEAQVAPRLELKRGDRIVFIGNTLAERMQHFNHFETLLLTALPDLDLSLRNMGWSADTLTLQPRPLNFGDMREHVFNQRPAFVFAFFGMNESFDGAAGLAAFEEQLGSFLASYATPPAGQTAPRMVLVSPIAHERLPELPHVDVRARNEELARYTDAMRRVASAHRVRFADLFSGSLRAMETSKTPLTINGIHLNDHGDRIVAGVLMRELGIEPPSIPESGPEHDRYEAARAAIGEKNWQFFLRWRPVNGEYVFGRRVEPFGSVNFPTEMRALDQKVADLEKDVWQKARAVMGSGIRLSITPPGGGRTP
jgi:hypothetical protein